MWYAELGPCTFSLSISSIHLPVPSQAPFGLARYAAPSPTALMGSVHKFEQMHLASPAQCTVQQLRQAWSEGVGVRVLSGGGRLLLSGHKHEVLVEALRQ